MNLADLIFPPRCVFCRKVIKPAQVLVCRQCKENIPMTLSGGRMEGEHFALCIAPFYYADDVRMALIRYKFSGFDSYASTFAYYVGNCILDQYGTEYDIISWVPLSRERLKARGYDQAQLLAEKVAFMLGRTTACVLEKWMDRPQQALAGNAEQRRANIQGAYLVKNKSLIAGKRILLIDDIVTTGSTFSECAKVLLQSGAASVLCAAVAKSKDS